MAVSSKPLSTRCRRCKAKPHEKGLGKPHGPQYRDPRSQQHQAPTVAVEVSYPIEGGCTCGHVRYRIESAPLFVHCCHRRWCQRETGASFALNAMIEASRVTNLAAAPEIVLTPSESGLGQKIARCPKCRVAVWSHYSGSGPVTKFVRVGSLDRPDLLPPDVHIFTASKQPWVVVPEGTPAFKAFYERKKLWPAESLTRRQAILPLIEAYQASLRDVASPLMSNLGRQGEGSEIA